MWLKSFGIYPSVVFKVLVSSNVINDSSNFVFVLFLSKWFDNIWDQSVQLHILPFEVDFSSGAADFSLFVAWVSSAWMSVVTDWCETSREDTNWVTFNTDVDWIRFDLSFQPFSPVSISNSWGTESDDFDLIEDTQMVDVDITDWSKSTSKWNTSDDESLGMRTFNKIIVGLVSDWVPHVVVLFLDFTSFWSMLILNLNGPK